MPALKSCATAILRSALALPALFGAAVALGDISVNAARGEVTVTSTLSHRSAEVGEPVQLQVEVAGHRSSVEPPAVKVDGLAIEYAGPSVKRELEMTNGGFRQHVSTTFIYRVTPQQAGNFQIPALAIAVDGQTYRTQPVGLVVQKGSGPDAGGAQEKTAFAELTVPRKTAFIGEVMPVELNLYVDASVPLEVEQAPSVTGSGFTVQKLPEAKRQRARKSGREWQVVSYRMAITPSKAGRLAIGPIDVPFVAEVPRPRVRSRDPFGSFFNGSPFDQMFAERRRYTEQAPAVELEVKPLPVDGRPAEFSGAIGKFKLTAEGNPKHVKVGDPVTLRLKVSGNGNFDRMQAPVLADAAGWHAYPASENFEPTDDLKTSGTKTFEVPVVPETNKKEMPRFQFAYFDPEKAKYVTLTSEAAPLIVDGVAPPPASATRAEAAPVASTPAAPKSPPSTAPVTDILGLRYDNDGGRATFKPLYTRPGFLLLQLAPLTLLLGLLGARFLRRSDGAARLSVLRRERDRLLRQLRNGRSDFYDVASRLVQVETAMATGLNPGSVDADIARRSLPFDEETAAAIDEIFGARAELLYAGSSGERGGAVSGDQARLQSALERFFKGRA